MDKGINERQAIILFACSMFAIKFQRLPAIMSQTYGRDSWLVLLIWLFVDGLILLLVLRSFKYIGNKTIFEIIDENYGKSFKIILCLFLIVYYFFSATLTYKATHEVFANTLFDKLSWEYFSVLFLFLLFILIKNGITVIGRSAELYSFFIAFGMLAILLLGFSSAKFERLLPVLDADVTKYWKESIKFVPWLGNYMNIIVIFGNVKIHKKSSIETLNKKIVATFFIIGFIVVFFFMIFYSVNENLSQFQTLALSGITQYSLLGLGVGRPDWFFVLFVFIATIISTSFFCWVMAKCLCEMFGIKLKFWLALLIVVIIYLGDVFLLPNIEKGLNVVQNYASYFLLFVNIVLPIILIIISCRKKYRSVENNG